MGEPRPVPRWLGWAAVATALAVNEPALEWAVVPDGEVASTAVTAAILLVQLAILAAGVYLIRRRPRSRIPLDRLVLAGGSALATAFLAFAVLDTRAPSLLEIPGVRYFSVKARYVPDSALVMRPRTPQRSVDTRFRGDLYVPGGRVPPVDVPYRATFNERGFRTNSAAPPYDVAVIGDSYVEFGEADSLTVSERLRAASGLSTYNLGRGWYGPAQYVELLRRHGLGLEPSFAVLFFFEGNDPRDVAEYRSWREGGGYYHFSAIEQHLVKRFSIAVMDLAGRLRDALSGRGGAGAHGTAWWSGGEDGEDGAWLRFAYYPERAPADELLGRRDWRDVRSHLRRFRDLSVGAGVVPVVVFVPTKLTVYRDRLARPEGARIREALAGAAPSTPSPAAEAVAGIAGRLGIPLVDLTPPFREAARRGRLLYYAADTHWNPAGRALAAEEIAAFLDGRGPRGAAPGEDPAADSGAAGESGARGGGGSGP